MFVDGGLVMLWPACSHCPDTGPGLTPAGAMGPLSTPVPTTPSPPTHTHTKPAVGQFVIEERRQALGPERPCHSLAVASWLPLFSVCKVGILLLW